MEAMNNPNPIGHQLEQVVRIKQALSKLKESGVKWSAALETCQDAVRAVYKVKLQ